VLLPPRQVQQTKVSVDNIKLFKSKRDFGSEGPLLPVSSYLNVYRLHYLWNPGLRPPVRTLLRGDLRLISLAIFLLGGSSTEITFIAGPQHQPWKSEFA
jgi:hypothetical protein